MKSVVTRIVAGFNAATVAMMLLVGFSDRFNPVAHPLFANLGLLFPLFLLLNVAFLAFWLVVCKKWALVSFAGLIIGFSPVCLYAPLNYPEDAPKGSIKVLSYNTFCFSTWKDASEPCELVDYILGQDADIVCLQEAETDTRKRAIIDSLMATKYAYNGRVAVEKTGADEINLYSKMPILDKEQISKSDETYNAVAYKLKTGAKDTTLVVVCHFETTGLSPEDRTIFKSMVKGDLENTSAEKVSQRLWRKLGDASAKRAPQADAVAEYLAANRGKSIILTGDFNDSPISYTHRRIASELTDCYVASANGPGISYHYNCFYVRIDNIMCSSQWQPYACHVDRSISASDHYPIVCWLKRR